MTKPNETTGADSAHGGEGFHGVWKQQPQQGGDYRHVDCTGIGSG